MKKTSLIISLVLIIILSLGGFIIYQKGTDENQNKENVPEENVSIGTNIGEKAPNFTLKKVNGEEVSLYSLHGRKIFLNFWATWCPPCRQEMPDIQKLYEEHKDITILAVNLRENKGQVSEFLMANGYNFPVVLDPDGNIGNQYMVRGIPTTYILDENGVIIDKTSGVLTYEQMLNMLEINE
ncbi:MAG: TlpA family protein disulfide reductase [Bacillota bacterium]